MDEHSEFRYNVIPEISFGHKGRLRDNLTTEVSERLRDFSFTPIIGQECSVIGRQDTMAWQQVAARMNHLALDERLIETEESAYIFSLAAQKEVRLDDDDPSFRAPPRDALHDFRVELVRLGHKANALFGQGMYKSGQAIASTSTYRIKPNSAELTRELDEFAEVLILTCVAAHKLIHEPVVPSAFDKSAVYARLVELTAQLTQGWLSPWRRRRLRHNLAISDHLRLVYREVGIHDDASEDLQHGGHPPDSELYFYHLEWIADLLWYTLRFSESTYPTDEELAFQIALGIGEHYRRPELVSAAERRGRRQAERIREWFKLYRAAKSDGSPGGNEEFRAFFDWMARYLNSQYHHYCNTPEALKPAEAVAFSTSLDLELEDALARIPIPMFHVAIPIQAKRASVEPESHLRWLLGTVQSGMLVEEPDWKWLPENVANLGPEMLGPLVIKLHGSPLHDLPDVTKPELGVEDVEYMEFEHALTLSESEYLQNIVLLSDLPRFCDAVLSDPRRAFFFLGHSLSDWNTKLRIFHSVYRGRRSRKVSRRLIAVSACFDPYRSVLLDSLGVDRWEGSLEELTELD